MCADTMCQKGGRILKKVFIPILSFLLSAGVEAAGEWISLSSTDAYTWEGRAGSLERTVTRGGKQVATASGRVINKKTSQISFEKWYVTEADCRAGYGKLITLNMDGDFQYESEFVETGGTVASSLASMLCSIVKQADAKGI